MNKYQTKGIFFYVIGSMEELAGKIAHDSRRQIKGYQRKVTGKAIMALGDAQRALKLCINARIPDLDAHRDTAENPVRQTTKL